MRAGKKLSFLLVIAFLVNILLTGMGAFAAESNNEELVPTQSCGYINDSQALPQPELQPGVEESLKEHLCNMRMNSRIQMSL
ncbi:MAG: hypothetical protein NUV45_09510 [Tepidanaerobacteraceae bacterium]|jgi:hypothetical protein|nr:hypothetical protein [Tepidanaerobacteraceae bacterium]